MMRVEMEYAVQPGSSTTRSMDRMADNITSEIDSDDFMVVTGYKDIEQPEESDTDAPHSRSGLGAMVRQPDDVVIWQYQVRSYSVVFLDIYDTDQAGERLRFPAEEPQDMPEPDGHHEDAVWEVFEVEQEPSTSMQIPLWGLRHGKFVDHGFLPTGNRHSAARAADSRNQRLIPPPNVETEVKKQKRPRISETGASF